MSGGMKILAGLLVLCSGMVGGAQEISKIHSEQERQTRNEGKKPEELLGGRSHEEVDSTNHAVTVIGIERSDCFGTCPVYTFIAKVDGTFEYTGRDHVERKGRYTGTIPIWYFHQLAQHIRESGYMELKPNYSRLTTDHPTTYTMVVMDGKRKTVSNYANAGPPKLWAIEQLIDNLLVAKAKWNPPEKAAKEEGAEAAK